ncbi:MAG: 50S ribosomal protein L31e [Candidatus Bathyarchaeota archaeon]|nr:50S ribosomal protein L31e [Candidatus Bathyarchaeota archaeon]
MSEKEAEAKKVEEEKEDVVEERIYTIPLRRAWTSPKRKRVPRAVRLIRDFITRHMKPERVIIGSDVNEEVWGRGIEKPPRRIKVKASRDKDDVVTVSLAKG